MRIDVISLTLLSVMLSALSQIALRASNDICGSPGAIATSNSNKDGRRGKKSLTRPTAMAHGLLVSSLNGHHFSDIFARICCFYRNRDTRRL
jgi:hypothetical protein